jgi:hypothetical protein
VLQGLRWFDASVIIPMLQIIWILLIMVSGNLYFQEFNRFSSLQLTMFLVGMGLLLLGIYCLTPSVQPDTSQPAQHHRAEDAVVAAKLLGPSLGKPSPAERHASPAGLRQQPAPPLCMLPALGQLDVQALMRLPHKHLLAVLHHLNLVPRTEDEARQLESTLESIAWQQRQHARPPGELQLRSCCKQQPETCPASQEQQTTMGMVQNPSQQLWPSPQCPGQQHGPLPSKESSCSATLQAQQQQQAELGSTAWQLQASGGPLSRPPHLQLQLEQSLARQPPSSGLCLGQPGTCPRHTMVINPLFEEQAKDIVMLPVVSIPQLWPSNPAWSGVPASLGLLEPSPAPPADHRGPTQAPVQPRRRRVSSIAKLTAAAKGAARGVRLSIIQTAELMAGMVRAPLLNSIISATHTRQPSNAFCIIAAYVCILLGC